MSIPNVKEKTQLVGFRKPYMYTSKNSGETYPAMNVSIVSNNDTAYVGRKATEYFVRVSSLSDYAWLSDYIGEYVYCDFDTSRKQVQLKAIYPLSEIFGN